MHLNKIPRICVCLVILRSIPLGQCSSNFSMLQNHFWGLLKHRLPSKFGWGSRICIPKSPGDGDSASVGTILRSQMWITLRNQSPERVWRLLMPRLGNVSLRQLGQPPWGPAILHIRDKCALISEWSFHHMCHAHTVRCVLGKDNISFALYFTPSP